MFTPNVQTSGTFNFFPSTAELIAAAYGRIQVKRTELVEQHIQDAIGELNLFLSAFNSLGPNLAQVDTVVFPLTQGVATYTIPAETVTLLDVILSYGSPSTDRYLYQLSRSEYAAIPEKTTQAPPTQLWFNRIASPTVTFYPVPDGNGPYIITAYRFRQVQDATFANGLQPEVPNRALDCLVAGLAHRLSRIYKPELEQQRKADAAEAWNIYAKQDTENTPMYIIPGIGHYYRLR